MPKEPKQQMYRGRPIGGTPPAAPRDSPPDPERVTAALRKLQKMHDDGTISDAEYQKKRKALLDALL